MNKIKNIKLDSSNVFAPRKPSVFSKLLPFMLIAGYMFANFYAVASSMSLDFLALESNLYTATFFLQLFFYAVLDYLILLVILWAYRFVLSSKPYFYLVRTDIFNQTFKFWVFIKNVVYGAIACLLFVWPYLEMYFPIINLLLNFSIIVISYASLSKHIDIMFKPMYFKILVYPWFIWEAISITFTIILGGY